MSTNGLASSKINDNNNNPSRQSNIPSSWINPESVSIIKIVIYHFTPKIHVI